MLINLAEDGNGGIIVETELTLLDHFAISAKMEDLAISPEGPVNAATREMARLPAGVEYDASRDWPKAVARARYDFAEAMMRERTTRMHGQVVKLRMPGEAHAATAPDKS